ncbi:TrkA-C domain protein [compost metagenome]
MALNTVELMVREGSKLAGKTLDALRSELEVTILLYQSGQELDWNPGPERVLMPGTKLLVVTTLESLRILECLNEERSSLTGQLGDIWRRFNRTATDS